LICCRDANRAVHDAVHDEVAPDPRGRAGVGAGYLIWLGLKTFREANIALPTNFDSAGSGRAFRDGIFVEALNPKTAAFFLAFIPQFIDATQNVATQFVILGMISVALNTTADIVVVYMVVARARLGFASRPKLTKRARQGSGVIMCGLGASLLFARRSP
jgi:threonine/homoserine/homoserine lactone efflux protein